MGAETITKLTIDVQIELAIGSETTISLSPAEE